MRGVHPIISHNALMVGLCPLIPLPFVDDFLRKQMMRGSYLAIAERHGVELEPRITELLARDPGSRLLGCLGALIVRPIRKLFRTFFYFLTAKECLDWSGEATVRGAMVHRAIARGLLPDKAEQVKDAMELSWVRHGGSPVMHVVRRKQVEDLSWDGERGAITRAGGGLAERSGGARVLADFDELLDRIERGRPLIDPLPEPEDG